MERYVQIIFVQKIFIEAIFRTYDGITPHRMNDIRPSTVMGSLICRNVIFLSESARRRSSLRSVSLRHGRIETVPSRPHVCRRRHFSMPLNRIVPATTARRLRPHLAR